jgi:hypothetical protein
MLDPLEVLVLILIENCTRKVFNGLAFLKEVDRNGGVNRKHGAAK